MASVFIKRAVLILALALVGWAAYVSWHEIQRYNRIEEEVSQLEAEAEKIRRENETFSERIGYFSSDAFREQEAKKKLGLKKNDETVVVIKPAPENATSSQQSIARLKAHTAPNEAILEEKDTSKNIPNFRKWQQLFF